ncbi:MAG: hypothetical protein HGA45_40825, partial [Chloroflexales bacterium]|nr:hypothetical protein [Chloroflexales bacterium]
MSNMQPAALFAATYSLRSPAPAALFWGEIALLEVELRNTGRSPWLTSGPHPTRLGF